MRGSRVSMTTLAVVFAVAVVGCSGAIQRQAPQDREAGEETGQATPPGPGLDEPGAAVQGRVGDAASIGGWTVLVREAEFSDESDDGSRKGRSSDSPRGGSIGVLKLEVVLSHDRSSSQSVSASDWSLVDADGDLIAPLRAREPKKQGERTIDPGETEDVEMYFPVPGRGAYVLRFEPATAAGGALNVAIP